MKAIISLFSIVPDLSVSKVLKTSLNCPSSNYPEPAGNLLYVSFMKALVSSLSSSPDLSVSYYYQIWSIMCVTAGSSVEAPAVKLDGKKASIIFLAISSVVNVLTGG